MNFPKWFFLVMIGSSGMAEGPASAAGKAEMALRGPHHRVWPTSLSSNGPAASGWIELGTGLHYFVDGEWKESRAEFRVIDGRAAAWRGQHRVTLAANLNSAGAVELVGPDGKRFRSHFAGLAYTDAASGRSVLIAEPIDCAGVIVGGNQVLYENAFAGDCQGDIRYTYTLGGFEQDILLLKAPPSPSEYDLPPETTRLEAWTEFMEIPTGERRDVVVRAQADRARAAKMREPDLIDQRLQFGAMTFVQGRVFPLQQPDPFDGASIPTGKSLERIEGRVFLIEKVDYTMIRRELDRLPPMAAAAVPRGGRVAPAEARLAEGGRWPSRPAGNPGLWAEQPPGERLARLSSPRPALVLDYLAVNSSLTNWTFAHDHTYLVRHDTDLHGTTVLEGTVIKFAPGASLNLWGELDCRTSTYQPAILTARDDDSVGAVLPGSTGRPAGPYAANSLACRNTAGRYSIHHVHVRHAAVAAAAHENVRLTLSHAQLTRSGTAIAAASGGEVTGRNVLVADVGVALRGPSNVRVTGEHATLHRVGQLAGGAGGGLPMHIALTNSLLIAVTNLVPFEGRSTVVRAADSGAFVTAGGGARYLSPGSAWRNAGTDQINPELRIALRGLTTHPPLMMTDHFTRDIILGTRTLRDTDSMDLGYHYAPLDYCWGSLRVVGARVCLTNGVTVGLYPFGMTYGLGLEGGARLTATGEPGNLTRLVRSGAIQEGAPDPGWPRGAFTFVQTLGAYDAEPRVEWRFVESVVSGPADCHIGSVFLLDDAPFAFRDCQFAGGNIHLGDTGIAVMNCLLDRVRVSIDGADDEPVRRFQHSLFRGGRLEVWLPDHVRVSAANNLFDRTAIMNRGMWSNSHNARVAGHDALLPTNRTDRVLGAIAYQSGALGRYYYPAQGGPETLAGLIDAGSAGAPALGLAHFSTLAASLPEGATPVDIGFHYAAVGPDGRARDTDFDGIPDWREDADGDAERDPTETDWQRYDSLHGLTGWPALEVFTPLR